VVDLRELRRGLAEMTACTVAGYGTALLYARAPLVAAVLALLPELVFILRRCVRRAPTYSGEDPSEPE
jgi:hypothetical protein